MVGTKNSEISLLIVGTTPIPLKECNRGLQLSSKITITYLQTVDLNVNNTKIDDNFFLIQVKSIAVTFNLK